MEMGNKKKLVFRNEYILTNKKIVSPKNSNIINIGKYHLYIGEDIKEHTIKNKTKQIVLLGYVFHCYDNKTERELINDLISLKGEELLDEIDLWCGHFVLFINNKKLKIYSDASASFKVFYGENDDYKIVGSDPSIINRFIPFDTHLDQDKADFYRSKYFMNNPTKIGHHTRFRNMYQLVSNHCLDLENNRSKRIFPREKRIQLSQKKAADKLIKIFQHLIKNINERYTIYVSLTAGYDSRLIMSTTKEISKNINYYTLYFPEKSKNFIDYKIPKEITRSLGLDHSFVKINSLSNKIRKEILHSYDLPKWRPFEQYYKIFPESKKPNILLVGFVGEVAKNYLERLKIKNGKDTTRAVHFPDNKYLHTYYQNWLNKNQKSIEKFEYELLDFIHWEQDITNFAGQNTHYAHHYVHLFSILNSREVLKIMLSVSPNKRDAKRPIFFQYLIKKMWPELLKYPFNPTMRERVIILMKKAGIYPFYKSLQLRFYSKKI